MKHYKAPWGASLIVISFLVILLCIGIAVSAIRTGRGMSHWPALLPIVIVGGGALFTIRGYTITSDAILIHRLFWTTRLALAGLQSAQFRYMGTLALGFQPDDIIYDGTSIWVACSTNGTVSEITRAQ